MYDEPPCSITVYYRYRYWGDLYQKDENSPSYRLVVEMKVATTFLRSVMALLVVIFTAIIFYLVVILVGMLLLIEKINHMIEDINRKKS